MVLPWTNWRDFLKRRSSKRAPLFRPVTKPAMVFTENFRQSWVVSSQKSLQLCSTDLKGDWLCRTRLDLGMGPMATWLWRALANTMANNCCSPGWQPVSPTPSSLSAQNQQQSNDSTAAPSTQGRNQESLLRTWTCCFLSAACHVIPQKEDKNKNLCNVFKETEVTFPKCVIAAFILQKNKINVLKMMLLEQDYLLIGTLQDMLETPQEYKHHQVTPSDRPEVLNPICSFKFSISLHKISISTAGLKNILSNITPYFFTKLSIIYCHQCEPIDSKELRRV